MTIKRITITMAILGSTIFGSLFYSNHPQARSTGAYVQAAAIDSETIEAGPTVSLIGSAEGGPGLSTISSEDQARMLASAVEFRYIICTGYNKMHAGLGTKIDAHTVLTHNHFGNQANFCMFNPTTPGLTHDIAIKADSRALGHGDRYGDQTLVVSTTGEVQGPYAALATRQMISKMAVGEFVQVVYWEDDLSELAIANFQIRGFLGDSVLVLDDPDDIINQGDSGGGVFYQGSLIGNTWRYLLTLDQDNQVIEKLVHVHLLTMEIETHSEWTD